MTIFYNRISIFTFINQCKLEYNNFMNIPKTQKELISEYLKQSGKTELELLKVCAYVMCTMYASQFNSICAKLGIDRLERNNLVSKFLESGIFQLETKEQAHDEDCYFLHPHAYIQLLIRIASERIDTKKYNQYTALISPLYVFVEKRIKNNRNYILSYLANKKIEHLTYDDDQYWDKNIFNLILPIFYFYDELRPLLLKLPSEAFLSVYETFYLQFSYQLNTDLITPIHFLVKENPNLPSNIREQLEAETLCIESIFSNNWAEINNFTSKQIPDVIYAGAYLEQTKGNYQEAVDQYQKGISLVEKSVFCGDPFYDYAYVAALMHLKTKKAKDKLVSLSKNRALALNEQLYQATNLLLQVATNSDLDLVAKQVYKETPSQLTITNILYLLTIKHYDLRVIDDTELNFVIKTMENKKLSHLHAILAPEFPKLAQQCGCADTKPMSFPLLPAFVIVPLWERTLETLLLEDKVGNTADKKVKTSRIVYTVNSHFEVSPRLQLLNKNGSWSKGRAIALSKFIDGTDEMTSFDKQVATCIDFEAAYSSWGYRKANTYTLQGPKVLKKLSGHPLVFNDENIAVVVEIVTAQPYIMITKDELAFQIESNVSDPDSKELSFCTRENNSRIVVMEMTARQKEIISLLLRVKTFPLEAEDKMKQLLNTISNDIVIHSDLIASNTNITQIEANASIAVQLLPIGSGFKASCYVKPFTSMPPYCIPGKGTKSVMGQNEMSSTQALRNLEAEKKNMQALVDALAKFEFDEDTVMMLETPTECLELLDTIRELDYASIEWPEGVKLKLSGSASLSNFTLSMKGKNSWFEMVGELRYNDDKVLALSDLINSMDTMGGQRFISLGNDEYLALSDELRKMLASIKSLSGKDKKGTFKISEFAAPIFRSFQEEGLQLNSDTTYKKLIKKIDKAEKMNFEVPNSLQASLREYQEDGFKWMARLSEWGSGACLADDMGLGKTVQTIAMLCRRASEGPALVVAPASVVQNWVHELNRFAPSLNVVLLNTEPNRTAAIKQASDFDVIISTFALLNNESLTLSQKHWSTIVLDEAHSIKNKETKVSKAAMQLEGDFRLLLTGTPIQNHLSEIWNLFQFMNPGMLGTFEQFNQTFITPIEVNDDKLKRKELKQLIAPFLLRRTKNEVLDELPGKTEIVIPIELNAKEELFYEELRRKAEASLLENESNSVQTLAEITRLRQAASHIGLVDKSYKEESGKMKAFFELVEEMKENNHRALVFSQFTSHLALFKEALDKEGVEYLYLDGSTPVAERGKLVKQFQTGNQLLFLISLKAGGLGLNLTAADFVVHLDPWWNPAIEDQASDRAYRIGQKRPVTVYRLISQNTIEEKIIELHRTKKDMADSLLDGTNQSHKLTRDELLLLLSRK